MSVSTHSHLLLHLKQQCSPLECAYNLNDCNSKYHADNTVTVTVTLARKHLHAEYSLAAGRRQ